MNVPTIAMTIGDPGGVGPEIAAKALADRELRAALRPVVIGDRGVLEEVIAGCGLPLEVRVIERPADATGDADLVEVIEVGTIDMPTAFGRIRADYGAAAAGYIERATELALAGEIDGIVTGPINKEALRASGSAYPGHTEMLAELLGVGAEHVVTMFTVERLRIFFLTRHHSLRDAIDLITEERVYAGIVRVRGLMGEIGFESPRIGVAALNPHGGEHGLMGTEDDDHVAPAIERARAEGIDASGPVPADSVFAHCREGRYDCVISLYHDQGHIAAKTLDFFGTVSSTLGLPVIRTAAEHGTAFDIAGRWIADPGGQIASMHVAAELAPTVVANRRG